MADEEEVELTEAQQKELEMLQQLQERMPALRNVADYNQLVRDDIENLVVVAALSSQCPHCRDLRSSLHKLSAPRNPTKNARFFRFDVHEAPDIAQELKIASVPAMFFSLKGVNWDGHVGAGSEKIHALFKNYMIKRNEVMREWDEAKKPKKAPSDDGEGNPDEEGEEGGEDDE